MALPTCPTGCAAELPIVSFDECNPEVCDAQISKVYMTNVGNPLTDWTDPVEWGTRLSNSAVAADAIRTLNVVGSKDKPSSNIKEISLKRKVIGQKDHTVNLKVDECSDLNHEAVRQLECGGNYLFWYETLGGKLFGSTDGITAFIELDMIIPESSDEIITYDGTLTWKAKFTEERIDSPI